VGRARAREWPNGKPKGGATVVTSGRVMTSGREGELSVLLSGGVDPTPCVFVHFYRRGRFAKLLFQRSNPRRNGLL
jgi:hypothetical protein